MEETISNLILKVNSVLSNYLNKQFLNVGLDLNTQQMVILMILWGSNGQRQQDLADRTDKDKASVTRLLDSMEKKGLIVRQQDKQDSRQKLIYVTDKGISIKPDVLQILRSDLSHVQQDINLKEMKICINVLKKVYNNISMESHRN